jgi:cellulose synthase/poly-beta-1,6-N-acetylglucosamine synthase-like glycosyltransferase
LLDGAGAPAVAVLYTTCNDFSERSAQSCVDLSYTNFRVYILDDSDSPEMVARVDAFAAANPARVEVVRRGSRRSFKAGNLNHALHFVAREPFFAIVDADEILPADFLSALAPTLISDPHCGFVQANHRSDPHAQSALGRDMGIGVDIHWKWYQPLRNDYGFVMFLGHGALLRRSCWEEVGGFPEIVSEDLGYAISIRRRGYYGVFRHDVMCLEEFPETVRAFRIRHVKWTRGTCEFLHRWATQLLRARSVTAVEKLDILFPTLNLPLTLFYFLFMVNAQFLFPFVLGEVRPLTFVVLDREFVVPVLTLRSEMSRIFGLDFYAITLLTIVAPVLCFVLELWKRPLRLFRFLTHSTALYAALSTLSFLSVLGYAATRRAQFYVTGDTSAASGSQTFKKRRLSDTHPDSASVRGLEIGIGIAFLASAIATVQLGFAGVALAFTLLPIMHSLGWKHPLVGPLSWLPFALILSGVGLGALGVAGLQPVFFGFGFHF